MKLPTLQGDIQRTGDNPHNPHNPHGRSCLAKNVSGDFFFAKKVDDAELCKMYDSHLNLLSVFAVEYRLLSYALPEISKSPIVSQDLEILEQAYLEILY